MTIPYDIDAYRPGVPLPGWPVAGEERRDLNGTLKRALIDLIRRLPAGETRDMCAVAAPAILSQGLTLAAAWLFAERARAAGTRVSFSGPSLARAFAEDTPPDLDVLIGRPARKLAASLAPLSSHSARRAAHGLIANRGFRLPWRKPAMVVNHNHLLKLTARLDTSHAFRFQTLDRLFGAPVSPAPAAALPDRDDAAAAWADAVSEHLARLGGSPSARLTDTVRDGARAWLDLAGGYAAVLERNWRRVPERLWTGTGGNFLVRLARRRVRALGGQVTGFDHGGGMHIHADTAMFHIAELAFADRFVTETPAKAEVYRAGIDEKLLWDPRPAGTPPEILAAPPGCTQFRRHRTPTEGPVRRVMVVTTAFVGETQYPWMPLLPDPVYADWLGRLIDGLAAAGFEVLCKQHPEGVRAGRPLEVSPRATYLLGRFADHLDKADAFVFDYPATTTLWEAMCTSKPVAFVDLGLAAWRPEVRADFAARCRIVPGIYDSENRPQVDFDRLADALRAPGPINDRFADRYLLSD